MWIKANAKLTENIYQVTTVASSHFLICGEKIALVDTGLAVTGQDLITDLEALFANDVALDYILLTHSHFDHVGGLSLLRNRWPQVKIVASRMTAERLKEKVVLAGIKQRNVECAQAFGREAPITDTVENYRVDTIVCDGDDLDLGANVTVKAISCPGHTDEQFAYYVSADYALTGGEAFGCYLGRDKIFPSFETDYRAYLNSLEKAAKLEVRVLGFPHSGTLTGDLAQKFLIAARVEAEKFCQNIKERLKNGELLDEIVDSLLPEWQAEAICPDGPFVLEQEEAVRNMVRVVAAQ